MTFGVVVAVSVPALYRRLSEFRRLTAVLLGVLMVFVLGSGSPAQAAVATHPGSVASVAAAADVACGQQADAASCDADGDNIPDAVEVVVCGSGTCATGREDTDTDGVPDWTEVMACGSTSCADPVADADGDGVPDFAEQLVCAVRGYTFHRSASS